MSASDVAEEIDALAQLDESFRRRQSQSRFRCGGKEAVSCERKKDHSGEFSRKKMSGASDPHEAAENEVPMRTDVMISNHVEKNIVTAGPEYQ